MRAKFIEWFLGIICAIVGAGIITVGIFYAMSASNFKKSAVETTALVEEVSRHIDSNGDTDYTIYISYTVDGKIYRTSYTSSSYEYEGNEIKVYYDKNNPNNMRKSISGFSEIGIIAMGVIFCAVGLGIIFNKFNQVSKKNYLLRNGEQINAEFENVEMNYSYTVNGRNPYVIVCKGRDINNNATITYRSENIWKDPEPIIRENNITSFPVYIDPNNPRKYYVSLEEIENN